MRTGWGGGLRAAMAGSLLFAGTVVSSAIAEPSPASAASVVQTITVGPLPVAISSDGIHVWVASGTTGPLTELDASTGAVVQTVVVGAPDSDTGVSSDGTHVWVASGNSLYELNASTGAVVQTINDPEDNADGFLDGVSSDGTHVWVTTVTGNSEHPSVGTVTELDASTGAVVQTIAVGDTPKVVSSDGTHVWVANYDSNTVTELDASTGSVVRTISVPSEPSAISSDGTHVWVTSNFYSSVTELDASTGAVVQTINNVSGAVSSDGTNVWVSAGGDAPGDVTELDASTGAVVGSTGVGPNPDAISSDGTDVWVANATLGVPGADGSVSEIATGSAPSTTVVLPANDATISGTPYLDATALPGVTRVRYEVSGGPSDLSDAQVATATQTIYGWVATWNTTTVPNGTYTLQSVASAGAQVLGTSAGTTVTVDNPAPSTTVVLPANDATISGTPYLDATASSGVTKVSYEVSGGPSDLSDVQIAIGTLTYVGWAAAWNTTTVPNGTYTLQSVASYAGGVSGTSPGTAITVDNPPPTSTVLVPSNNATESGMTAVLDASNGPNDIVTGFAIASAGGTPEQVVPATLTPYGWIGQWNTQIVPNGTYTVESVASYASGMSAQSAPVTVTVNNPLPTTMVLVPSNGEIAKGTAAVLDASVSGQAGVVTFVLTGGTLTHKIIATGTLTAYGWFAQWNSTTVPDGTYTLQSGDTVAYLDGTLVTVASPGVTITVDN